MAIQLTATGRTAEDLLQEKKERMKKASKDKAKELLEVHDWKTTRHLEQLDLVSQGILESTTLTQQEFINIATQKQTIRELMNAIENEIATAKAEHEGVLDAIEIYISQLSNETIPDPAQLQSFIDDPDSFLQYAIGQV